MPKLLSIHTPNDETQTEIKDGLNRLARLMDYATPYELLLAIVRKELIVQPMPTNPPEGTGHWILISRIADPDTCAECGVELEEKNAFAELRRDGTLAPTVCNICAVH